MSHLSQIKTKIQNTNTLQKTLKDLGFIYKLEDNNLNITVKNKKEQELKFIWDGEEYLIVVDIEMWTSDTYVNNLVDKITQQYSYNSIVKESNKYGFTNMQEMSMVDGSIKLIVQRWN